MRITILCEDQWIELVRETAKEVFSEKLTLKTPLSKNGKLPATHWLCVLYVTEEFYQKIIKLRKYSIITESSPKLVMSELELKKIE